MKRAPGTHWIGGWVGPKQVWVRILQEKRKKKIAEIIAREM
jgi:hypothetical protein